MSLDNIVKALAEDAQVERDKIQQAAEQELTRLKKETDLEYQTEKERVLTRAKSQATRQADIGLFEEKSILRKQELSVRRQLIDQVYDGVLKRLAELSDQEYLKVIEGLMADLPDVEGEIISAKGKRMLTEKAAQAKKVTAKLSHDEVESVGGFVWQSDKLNIDNTFEQLVDNLRQESEIEAAQVLFGQ